MLNMNIYLESVSYFVLSFLIRQKQIHATIGRNRNYMDYLILEDIEVYGAVGHKVHIPLMNQISGCICSPLNMPLMKFEIVCSFCYGGGGHRVQTPKLVSLWL